MTKSVQTILIGIRNCIEIVRTNIGSVNDCREEEEEEEVEKEQEKKDKKKKRKEEEEDEDEVERKKKENNLDGNMKVGYRGNKWKSGNSEGRSRRLIKRCALEMA